MTTLKKRMKKAMRKGPLGELEEEVKELQKGETRLGKEMMSYGDMNLAMGNSINKFTAAQKYAMYQGIKKHMKDGIDYSYLKAIIFPELYSSDIPQPYTNLSYCRFSDRSNVNIYTGAANSGTANLLFYPRVNQGPCLFYQQNNLPWPADLNPIAAAGSIQYGMVQSYESYFTQCNLVAASISIQYIGQLELESGIMVGSQVFGVNPTVLTTDDIENGQYVTRARPSEGLRFVYLPQDTFDYNLYPCTTTSAHNAGSAPTGNEGLLDLTFTVAGGLAQGNTKFINGSLNGTTTAPPGTAFATAGQYSLAYASNTNYIAVYWAGLPDSKPWLRVDTMRRFIGIPKTTYRDIVEVVRTKKNFDAKKTFDILRYLCINSPVGGHTLKELDRSQDKIAGNLMNAGEAIHLGHLTGIETLDELGESLQLGNKEKKGLVSQFGSTDRIYPYSI